MPGSLTVRCAGRNVADRSRAWGNRRYLPYRRSPSGSILPFLREIASIPGSPRLRIRPGMQCARRCRGNPAVGIRPTGYSVCGALAYRAHNARSRTTPGESATNPPQDLCRRTAGRYDAAPNLQAGSPRCFRRRGAPGPMRTGRPGVQTPGGREETAPGQGHKPIKGNVRSEYRYLSASRRRRERQPGPAPG